MVCTSIFKLAIGRDYQEKREQFGLSEAPLHLLSWGKIFNSFQFQTLI
jgi:hypothetical protein